MPPGEARRFQTVKLQNEAVEMVGEENHSLLLLPRLAFNLAGAARRWAVTGRPGPSRPTAASSQLIPSLR